MNDKNLHTEQKFVYIKYWNNCVIIEIQVDVVFAITQTKPRHQMLLNLHFKFDPKGGLPFILIQTVVEL